MGKSKQSNVRKDIKLGGIAATKFIDKRLSNAATSTDAPEVPAGNSDSSNDNAYSGENKGVYQNSDQVREHYLRQIEQQQQSKNISPFSTNSNRHQPSSRHDSLPAKTSTPIFWEERQQMRKLEAEGFRNKGNANSRTTTGPVAPIAAPQASSMAPAAQSVSPKTISNTAVDPYVTLVRVATHTLEGLANTLEHNNNNNDIVIPMEDRSAFAKAIQRAMQALAAATNA
mmetsp:Transcript_8275/g.19102  ORF Transcript_8275/g.19102 Transcript_8275/m.19102 type:complete len:228 (+) Transcript_8275:102-785(+)